MADQFRRITDKMTMTEENEWLTREVAVAAIDYARFWLGEMRFDFSSPEAKALIFAFRAGYKMAVQQKEKCAAAQTPPKHVLPQGKF